MTKEESILCDLVLSAAMKKSAKVDRICAIVENAATLAKRGGVRKQILLAAIEKIRKIR